MKKTIQPLKKIFSIVNLILPIITSAVAQTEDTKLPYHNSSKKLAHVKIQRDKEVINALEGSCKNEKELNNLLVHSMKEIRHYSKQIARCKKILKILQSSVWKNFSELALLEATQNESLEAQTNQQKITQFSLLTLEFEKDLYLRLQLLKQQKKISLNSLKTLKNTDQQIETISSQDIHTPTVIEGEGFQDKKESPSVEPMKSSTVPFTEILVMQETTPSAELDINAKIEENTSLAVTVESNFTEDTFSLSSIEKHQNLPADTIILQNINENEVISIPSLPQKTEISPVIQETALSLNDHLLKDDLKDNRAPSNKNESQKNLTQDDVAKSISLQTALPLIPESQPLEKKELLSEENSESSDIKLAQDLPLKITISPNVNDKTAEPIKTIPVKQEIEVQKNNNSTINPEVNKTPLVEQKTVSTIPSQPENNKLQQQKPSQGRGRLSRFFYSFVS